MTVLFTYITKGVCMKYEDRRSQEYRYIGD